MTLMESLSARALAAPQSGIVELVNYARGRPGLIPLWAGEGDLPSPSFINQATKDSLDAGETFYTWQRGLPELRDALSHYYRRHFGVSLPPEHFFATSSGMHAINLCVQSLTGPGDEVIYLTPSWPNIVAAIGIASGRPVPVPVDFVDGGWSLDIAKIEAAVTPATKALFINTPSNPTGWTATEEDLKAVLALARRHGLWIIADEIYALYFYNGVRAPSFLDIQQEGDRIIYANSFSKNWSMTGWRVGWIVAPPEMGQVLENLIQYSSSGLTPFMQRGAIAALEHGDDFLRSNIERARTSRDILCDALIATNRVQTLKPDGAIYAFLKIDGIDDPRKAAFDIVDKTLVGLAPGSAFGPGGGAFLRACFLRDPQQVKEAAHRLCDYILKL